MVGFEGRVQGVEFLLHGWSILDVVQRMFQMSWAEELYGSCVVEVCRACHRFH